jgi:LuxR family transcriptional regulator, maltose regulon positive regulatory protein
MTVEFVRSLPRVPSAFVVRQRLYDLLDRDAPITVVRAIQGFGKTTLLAGWLETLSPDVVPVWVSLTSALGQKDEFLRHLRRRMSSAGLIGEGVHPLAPTLVELDEALVALSTGLTIVLVVDNMNNLGDAELAADLVTLVQRHRNLRLVIATRTSHAIEDAAVGAVVVQTIGSEDLQLTAGEVVQLAEQIGVQLEVVDATNLLAEIGGWIAPARLAIEAIRMNEPPDSVAEAYVHHLTAGVRGDRGTVASLMRFSLAEQLELDLVSALVEVSPGESIDAVETLVESGLLERRRVGGRQQLFFPTLVQRYLRREMSRDRDASRAFHLRLAKWYIERASEGDPVLAFHHAVHGADFDLAHEVWSEHILMMAVTRPARVASALGALPPEALRRYPGFAVSLAVSRAIDADTDLDSRLATLGAIAAASARVVARGVDDLSLADLLYIGTGHIIGLRLAGSLEGATTFAEGIAARAAMIATQEPGCQGLLSWFAMQRAITLTLNGQDDQAIGYYQTAWAYGLRASPSHVPTNTAANLAMIYAMRGDTARAKQWIDRYETQAGGSYRISPLASVGAHVAVGLMALDSLDPERCQRELDILGDGADGFELWPFVVYLNAQFDLHFGNPRHALFLLNRAVAAHGVSPGAKALGLIARAKADLLLATNDGQSARRVLLAADRSVHTVSLAIARIALLSGDPKTASGVTAGLFNDAVLHPRDRLDALVLGGVAALQLGELQIAEVRIGNAAHLAELTGIHRALRLLTQSDQQDIGRLPIQPLTVFGAPVFPDHIELVDLTKREQQLLEALVTTSSRADIARQLFLSVNTVKTQCAALYRKLGVRTRPDAILKGRQLGLLREPERVAGKE